MDFKVYVVIEAPVLDKEFEVLVPIDRRIHDLVSLMKQSIPAFSTNYYENNSIQVFNKITGKIYDMNLIIKDSDIKTGTKLILI